MKHEIALNVNGRDHHVAVEARESLLDVLRERLGLTGTKNACNTGECGACTVMLEGKPVNSCLVLAVDARGKKVVTIEGLASGGQRHPLQEAFIDNFAVDCGFCTAGMILMAKALLDANPHPTEEQIRRAISGNICRCTGYTAIVQAIQAVSERIGG